MLVCVESQAEQNIFLVILYWMMLFSQASNFFTAPLHSPQLIGDKEITPIFLSLIFLQINIAQST